jgi:hypothetical protein
LLWSWCFHAIAVTGFGFDPRVSRRAARSGLPFRSGCHATKTKAWRAIIHYMANPAAQHAAKALFVVVRAILDFVDWLKMPYPWASLDSCVFCGS